MKKQNIIFVIILVLILSFANSCGNDDSDSISNPITDIIPEDSKNESQYIINSIEDTKHNDYDDIYDKEPFDVEVFDKSKNSMFLPYTIPVILRKEDTRLRTHPSFMGDVISIVPAGTSITLTKRTNEKRRNIEGKEHYWYYVSYKSLQHNPGKLSGWVYGGDVFNEDYEYPYKNNLQIVNFNESLSGELNFDSIENILYEDYIIDKERVTLFYRPNVYSSPVYILSKGDSINIFEKSIFKDSLYEYSYGRWYYVRFEDKEGQLIKGWAYESKLPEIPDYIIDRLPYNHIYKSITEKPVYIADFLPEKTINDSTNSKKEPQINFICQINSNGVISEIQADYGYFDDMKFDDMKDEENGYWKWANKNIKDNKFYLYHNGNNIGTLRPDINLLKKSTEKEKSNNIILNGKLNSNHQILTDK
ncbi:MAG: hypothetical protein ACOCV8_04720, partial [Spirochaetota bacterium]